MADESRIGLQIRFNGDIRAYDKWRDEWKATTKMIRLGASKRGIDLSKMEIVGKEK